MQCVSCGSDNPDGMKFCGECGAPLKNRCPQCSFENPPKFKFCGECGSSLTASPRSLMGSSVFPAPSTQPLTPSPQSPVTYTPKHLAERILAEQAAMEARGATQGERKTITALFADIKGSTALIEDLDPEEAQSIIDPTLKLMMEAVHRYEGYVAQSMGDGIFALFGAPIAHEDHAQRALYAALRMQEESRRQAERLRLEKGINLQLRVGINTGEVVVRSIRKDDLHTDYVPVGHSTNLASRMESLATPGAILVSEYTHRLTDGYFEFKSLGAAQVKGVSEPVRIYEVVGIGSLRTKLQVSAKRGLARFIGRQRELEALQQALEQTKAGHGQIAGVMGEPGVGKSRLFHEFKLATQSGCLLLETFSVSHGKAYPYLPLIDLLKNYFQFGLQDDERKRREKITGRVLTLDRNLEDILPYLFALFGIAEPTSSLQQMDPQIRRKRTFEAIKRLLIRESLSQPLVLIFEDLHWLDNETQAFLSQLSESIASAKLFLLVNYRPEYRHEWGNKTYYTQLRLDPLGKQEAEEMLTALLEEKMPPLPARERDRVRVMADGLQQLKRFILEKTEGNPFFMEEIVQALHEQGILTQSGVVGAHGRAPLPTDLHLPQTVQAVLASRIDRLPPEEKDLLQMLAVIGKEFSLGLIKQVVKQSDGTLLRLLSHLQAAEFIYEQPAFPEPEYVFKHALTQEVAYNSLLIERRKDLHERAARAVEAVFPSRLEDHYSELAYHYSRSGNTQKAVDYLQLAGQQAVQRSANEEAISHLTAALELQKTLPDTPKRTQQELALQIALGPALMASKGIAATEVEVTYTRARELSQQEEETPQRFPVLAGLWWFYEARSELLAARELAEQLLRLAQKEQDAALLSEAHCAMGVTLLWLGEIAAAREHTERGIAFYEPEQHRSLALLYGNDPGTLCRSYVAFALWALGYPDQALKRTLEAVILAQELSHPHSLVWAQSCTAVLYQLRREEQTSHEWTEAQIVLATEQGFPLWVALGTVYQGWALAERGQGENGIGQIHKGLGAFQSMGTESSQTLILALLANTYGKVGQTEEGLTTLAEALTLVNKTGERFYEAELYRLKGELTLQQANQKAKGKRQKQLPVVSSQLSVPNAQSPTSKAQSEAEAEECFLKAIEVAQRQQAKSLELRATMSLARLWQQQGKQHEARNMLFEIYSWFTEGFDTLDLKDAKALLAELEGKKARKRTRQEDTKQRMLPKANTKRAEAKRAGE